MRKKAEIGESKSGDVLRALLPKKPEKEEKKKSVLTVSTMTELKKVFDKKGLQFFLFYARLRDLATKKNLTPEDTELLGDLNQSFARMVKLFIKQKDKRGESLSSITVGKVMSALQELFPLLNRLGQMILSGKIQEALLKRILSIYVPVMSEVAKEKNIFIQGKPLGGEKPWVSLGKMIPSVAKLEKLKDEDPYAYEVMTKRKEQFDEVQKAIEEQVKEAGYTYEKKYMRVGYKKALVHIGKDPNTGEEFVYDPMDETKSGVPIAEYLEKAMQTEKALKEAAKENQKRGRVAEYSEKVALNRLGEMRIPNWEEVSQKLEGDTEFVSIYDDLAKQGGLTKIIPTKELDLGDQKVKVVTSGRYEGVLFDELVNIRGRLIEGNSYAFDEKLQRPVQVKPGEREPYVSVATVKKRVGKGQFIEKRVLFLEFPSKKGKGLNEEKNRIKKLGKDLDKGTGGKVDSISWKRLSSNSHIGVYFEPKDFALIRRNLSSMALSAEATRLIREYNEDLAKAQVATEEKNLEFYTPEALGGFKPVLDNGREFKLLHKQKQGIAWLDANENKGVLALDTGIGKTVSAIAIMQKLKRDGFNEDENTNGRYLYVAPKALVGNMDKEVRIFLDEGNKNDLLGRLDAVSYEDFGRSLQRDGSYRVPKSLSPKLGEGVWELEKYVAIFFDEAQAFKKLGAKHTKAAFNLYHPRKISLTASPMEKEPKEAFILSAISNNIDLTAKGAEGRENRKKMLQFKNRFLKTVGGRVVDIKDDPDTMHDLDVWVKRNIFYAEKTEVKDTATPLPELKKQAESALMSAETKALYKETSSEIAFYMEGMLKKFKKELSDTKGQATAKEYEQLFGMKLRPFMKILNSLSNYPNIAIKQIATAMLGDRPRDLLTQKEFDSCKKFFAKLSKKFDPQELLARAEFAPNPKINTVAKKLNEFLETSENSRSLVFSDDKKMVSLTARDVSKKVPGIHVAADDAEINFYESGKKLTEFRIPVSIGNHEKVLDEVAPLVVAIGGEKLTKEQLYQNKKNMKIRERFLADPVATFSLPFTAKEYRLFPQLPEHPVYNKKYEASKWQKFVLDEIVGKNIQDIKSLNLLGSVYSTGQNLQQFDKVIHTDRNTWNNEEMKQRTARAWRQGQVNPVEEVIVDAIYDDVDYEKADEDPTLDVVRKFHQEMESELFNNIIKRSQETDISKEYKEFRPRGASFMKVDKQNAFFALSPYLKRSNPINEGSEE